MMSRITALVAAALGLALIAVSAIALVRGGEARDDVPVLRGDLLASSTLEPGAHLFGERVSARVEVVYDTTRVRRDSIQVDPSFAPYRVLERRESHDSFGHVGRLRFDFALECLTARCLPRKSGLVQFPRTRLEYSSRAVPVQQRLAVDWPRLRVAPRVGGDDLQTLPFQANARDLPAVSYRIRPRTFAAAGYSVAAVLGLAGLLLLLRTLGARAHLARALAGRRSGLTALQRALALVRRDTERGEHHGSRRALERLAAELRHTSEPGLARDASRLAWRRNDPSGTSVEPLSDEVERVIARERE